MNLKWENSIQVPPLAYKGLYEPEMEEFYTGTAVSTQKGCKNLKWDKKTVQVMNVPNKQRFARNCNRTRLQYRYHL